MSRVCSTWFTARCDCLFWNQEKCLFIMQVVCTSLPFYDSSGVCVCDLDDIMNSLIISSPCDQQCNSSLFRHSWPTSCHQTNLHAQVLASPSWQHDNRHPNSLLAPCWWLLWLAPLASRALLLVPLLRWWWCELETVNERFWSES